MNYATIKDCDIANGPGVRVSLFVSGCTHRCKDCFNQEAWDFNYGKPFDQDVMDQILGHLKPGYIKGITYLGGEPMDPQSGRTPGAEPADQGPVSGKIHLVLYRLCLGQNSPTSRCYR